MNHADVNGSHIQELLLMLLFRHFPKLIRAGHLYIAQPPLFRVHSLTKLIGTGEAQVRRDMVELNGDEVDVDA